MPLLQVEGSLDLRQFWPNGNSDADTIKVTLDLAKHPFQYRRAPGEPFKITHAFDNARVENIRVIQKNSLSVRLQGVDAPELHYQPQNYRQPYAQTAVVALAARLAKAKTNPLPCLVQTNNVATPNDVFDKYGRFVGDIIVTINKKRLNLNLWLLAQGYALPSFYVSMSNDEIRACRAAARKGLAKGRTWKLLSRAILPFNPKLTLRKNQPFDPAADKAPFILPKLFRRQCLWWNQRQAGKTTDDFLRHLTKSKTKIAAYTEDFLVNGTKAATHPFASFFANETFQPAPDEIVFLEDPSTLIGPDNKPVLTW
ncbi:MAG: thermonuclease family protein [Verrucomicrobiae bacterium]|nr:thermonuclease family protein [Verrucomicrobiae bacterium]